MSLTAEQLLEAALELPESDRAEIAARLQDSIEFFATPEIAAAWRVEIAKRLRASDAGEVELIPAEEVHARLKAKYGFFGG
jgi:putative addiction module component (TIGR02574 family)